MYHVLFFIFFFNDTATTEIYTLSLHDALPICPGAGAGAPADRRGPRPVAGRARRRLGAAGGERLCCDRRRQPTRAGHRQRAGLRRPARPGGEGADRRGADRKSTRLNSSHANISYAVFCLKKKTVTWVLTRS